MVVFFIDECILKVETFQGRQAEELKDIGRGLNEMERLEALLCYKLSVGHTLDAVRLDPACEVLEEWDIPDDIQKLVWHEILTVQFRQL